MPKFFKAIVEFDTSLDQPKMERSSENSYIFLEDSDIDNQPVLLARLTPVVDRSCNMKALNSSGLTLLNLRRSDSASYLNLRAADFDLSIPPLLRSGSSTYMCIDDNQILPPTRLPTSQEQVIPLEYFIPPIEAQLELIERLLPRPAG